MDDTIFIYVKSKSSDAICPYCNTKSGKIHSYYERSFQNLPIQSKKTLIILKNRKMFCQNPDCNKNTFAERFQFILSKSKKTKRLEDEILSISQNVSSVAASKILKKNIAQVSESTICNFLKKINLMIDKGSVKKVCIDDFALKRREKYATVMIDITTGKAIDILNSRNYDDVKEWLDGYPSLEVISRDGSITYSKAIKDSHSSAIQISDRFHLLKNLTDYCKEYIKRTIKHIVKLEAPVVKILESKDIPEIKEKYQ